MAYKESNMIPLGSKAPNFRLLDTISDKWLSLNDIKGAKATVVMFICNHCPYVIHVNSELVKLAKDYLPQEVGFVAISSNDAVNYPDDSPEKMKLKAKEEAYPFPYLYDESQQVAKDYDAACTPDLYIFDADLCLAYRGRLDDSRPNSGKELTGKDMRDALDKILQGKPVETTQFPSAGCNIKWKK